MGYKIPVIPKSQDVLKILVEKKKMFNPENVIEQFEALTMDAGRVQEETLRRILEDNNETEYLRKWGLN
nr:jasmonic acid-amido synthetase JAR1-like isoform X1 [Ipomoea batatas]